MLPYKINLKFLISDYDKRNRVCCSSIIQIYHMSAMTKQGIMPYANIFLVIFNLNILKISMAFVAHCFPHQFASQVSKLISLWDGVSHRCKDSTNLHVSYFIEFIVNLEVIHEGIMMRTYKLQKNDTNILAKGKYIHLKS